MKHMKQALALLLTLVLALALTVPALAATATWEKMAEGNSVLAPESAYTPASVQAALTAYQHFLDAKTGSQAEKDAYNNEFKPAILALEFKPHTFSDAPSDWYDKALNFVFSTGRMNGVGNNLFDPQGTMTRAMAVTILWRMNGEPAPKAASGFKGQPQKDRGTARDRRAGGCGERTGDLPAVRQAAPPGDRPRPGDGSHPAAAG